MKTLQESLKLKIDDYGSDAGVQDMVWNYFWFIRDYMDQKNFPAFLHTRKFF